MSHTISRWLPVWISTGPLTTSTLPPAWRTSRIRCAISATSRGLGFSEETWLPMKAKTGDWCRGRSNGTTRTPSWPTTMGSPARTSFSVTQRADPCSASTRIAQSISV